MSKQKRHTPEQIASILKQQEGGLATSEICRQHGISEQTFYRWKSKYGGMGTSEVKRLKHLEDENRRLKQMVADQALDIEAMKTIIEGKYQGPARSVPRCGQLWRGTASAPGEPAGWRVCQRRAGTRRVKILQLVESS